MKTKVLWGSYGKRSCKCDKCGCDIAARERHARVTTPSGTVSVCEPCMAAPAKPKAKPRAKPKAADEEQKQWKGRLRRAQRLLRLGLSQGHVAKDCNLTRNSVYWIKRRMRDAA